ncbi:MAG: hypothetical protein AAB134_03275, partial [Pseudomonadota bacterium]
MISSPPLKQILLSGLVMEALFLGVLGLGELNRAIPLFLLLYSVIFAAYLWSVRAVLATDKPPSVVWIVGFALLFRATLFFSAPSLSDDIYRYVWDGTLVNHGTNPYQYAPGALELSAYRDVIYERVNHKDIGTPYGPIMMLAFAAAEQFAHSIHAMKILFLVFDGLVILLLLRLLDMVGKPRSHVLLYAWNPLAVVEIAGSGHNDILAVFLMLASLYLLLSERVRTASFAAISAVAAKYFALLFLPAVWKRLGPSKWFIAPLGLALFFGPFYPHLDQHLASVFKVGATWRFNDSTFALLNFITGSPTISKVIAATIFGAVAVTIYRSDMPPLKGAMWLIGAALLLTTTLHPWYVLWLLPFLCFYPQRAWILFTGLVMLSYHVAIRYAAEGVWEESLWVKLAIYVPFFALLLAEMWRGHHMRTTAPSDINREGAMP